MKRFSGHTNKLGFSVLAFLIWPMLTLPIIILNYRHKMAKYLTFLFILFYGFTFTYASSLLDADRIIRKFHQYSEYSNLQIISDFIEGRQFTDLLQPLLLHTVSLFTDYIPVLFASLALVFGFFYVNAIWRVIDKMDPIATSSSWLLKVLLILLFFLVPIWEINGFRMWTASYVFLYSIAGFLLEKDRKKLWLAFICPLIHFSFSFIIPVILIYLLFSKVLSHKVIFGALLISFFIQDLSVDTGKLLSYAPQAIENKGAGYTHEEYLSSRKEAGRQLNWYIRYRSRILRYAIIFLIGSIVLGREKKWTSLKNEKNFLKFSLILYTLANLGAVVVPALSRFIHIAVVFNLAAILIVLSRTGIPIFIRRFSWLVIFIVFYYLVIEARIGFDRLGIATVIGNPFTASFLVENNTPLIQLIK